MAFLDHNYSGMFNLPVSDGLPPSDAQSSAHRSCHQHCVGTCDQHRCQVTLVYEFIGFSASQIFAVSGSIGNNEWSAPVVLSGGDTSVGSAYFAVSPSGSALTVWVTGSSTPQVHAVVRATGTGTWSGPATISGSGSELSPEAMWRWTAAGGGD